MFNPPQHAKARAAPLLSSYRIAQRTRAHFAPKHCGFCVIWDCISSSRVRLLRWAGHVSRMPMSWAPRQLLAGWTAHPRPKGSPLMTFGRTLKKALVRYGQSSDFALWSQVAANRFEWRKLYGKMKPLPRPKPTSYAERSSRALLRTPTDRRPCFPPAPRTRKIQSSGL